MTDYSYGLSHKVSSEHSPWCKKVCQLCVYLKKNVPDCEEAKCRYFHGGQWLIIPNTSKRAMINKGREAVGDKDQRHSWVTSGVGGHLQNTQSLQIFQQGEWHLKPLLDFSLHSKRWNQCGHVGGAKQLSCSHSPGERVKAWTGLW